MPHYYQYSPLSPHPPAELGLLAPDHAPQRFTSEPMRESKT